MYISCKLIVWWYPHAFPVDAHDIAVCSASFQKRKCFMLKQIKNEKQMETHELKTISSRWMKSIKHHTINGQTHIYRPFISTGSAIFDLILDEKV